jgi:hypothetical protein
MVVYIIGICFIVLCWIATYILSIIAIRKYLKDACFYTWYYGKRFKVNRMPNDRITDINSTLFNKIGYWVWGCWVATSLWVAIILSLLTLMPK